MNTFEEYIVWVKENQPQLDQAWIRAESERPDHPRRAYAELSEKILGELIGVHPMNDNGNFCVAIDLKKSLELLSGCGWKVTEHKKDQEVGSFWTRGSVMSPDYFGLLHENGLGSIKLFENTGCVQFYFADPSDQIPLVQRFTSIKEAEYLAKISKERKPTFSSRLHSRWTINPYGGGFGGQFRGRTIRDQDRAMEDAVLQLMRAIIEERVTSLYQSYIGWYCVVNPPSREKFSPL